MLKNEKTIRKTKEEKATNIRLNLVFQIYDNIFKDDVLRHVVRYV